MATLGVEAEYHANLAVRAICSLCTREPSGRTVTDLIVNNKPAARVGRVKLSKPRIESAVIFAWILELALRQSVVRAKEIEGDDGSYSCI